MKRRFVALCIAAALVGSSVTGCGNSGTVGQNAGTESQSRVEAEGTDQAETGSVQTVSYDYEQELNVIDDNYRNYYQIFVYSFCDSNGDGVGDLNGITEKLDYIADLGFNGIWLTPIMPSPTYHKYDVIDYCAVDEVFGTIEDFEELVKGCHDRGINLIIDMVANHSSSQNPWFEEACAYLRELPEGAEPDVQECPYVDYYHFSKEQVSGTWYGVAGTDWYYEGSFWSEMPDLNVENEGLRKEFEKISDFWIEKGVDGFRMDAAMHYDDGDSEVNTGFLNWLYSYCKEKNPDFYMVSEVWAAEDTIASYYESMTPSMFNFDTSSVEGCLAKTAMGTSSAENFVDKMMDYQQTYAAVNPDFIDAPFLTNHDQVRIANNLQSNADNLKMAAGLLLTMNGSPFVYYGEEIGMKSGGTADENKRLPMLWSASGATEMPKPAPGADDTITSSFPGVDAQMEDPLSLLNYYKRALRIRNENPEIARGEIEKVEALCDGELAAITKTYDGSTIGIVYHTSADERTVDLTGTELEAMDIRGYLTGNGEVVTRTEKGLVMPAKSICILK